MITHNTFKRDFVSRSYHGDIYVCHRSGRVSPPLVIDRYEPDPRCPALVVWQRHGCGSIPGFRRPAVKAYQTGLGDAALWKAVAAMRAELQAAFGGGAK